MSLVAFVLIAILAVASGGLTGSAFVLIAIPVVAAFIWAVSKNVFFPGTAIDRWQANDLTEQQAQTLEEKSKFQRRKTIVVMLVVVIAGPVGIWALSKYVFYPDVIIKYKLTAEVAMRGRTYTGSAVIDTRWTETLFNPLRLADNWTEREKGEAVVVDMAENGVVLITLAGYPQQQPGQLPQTVFGTEEGASSFRGLLRTYARDRRVKSVQPDRVPVVIWLKDRLDPSSAICVEPSGTAPAVALAPSFPHVQMQMVDEPATETIEAALPWLHSRFSDPHDGGSTALIDLHRRYPERVCHCTSRDLKRNQL